MKTLLLLALVAAFVPCLVSTSEAEQEIKVRAICFQAGFPVELYAHDPSGSATAGLIEVKSFLNHESKLLKPKGNTLVFTRRNNPASATDLNEIVGKIEIPEGSKSLILLFLPESVDPTEFHSRVVAIDDSAKAFPAGTFNVLNLTDVPLKIELEKESFEFEAGETKLIAKPPFGENQSASMQAYCKRKDAWAVISTGAWPNPGTRRVIQIALQNPKTKQIELKGVRDVAIP